MPLISRRQPYRNPRIKDPSAEVTTEQNLRVRPVVGAQVAGQRRRLVRQSGTQAANRILFLLRRNVRIDFPTDAGAILTVGGQQARYMRRRVMQSGYLAFGVLRANSWPQPYDPTVYPGEVTLTELERLTAFTETQRGIFTELVR